MSTDELGKRLNAMGFEEMTGKSKARRGLILPSRQPSETDDLLKRMQQSPMPMPNTASQTVSPQDELENRRLDKILETEALERYNS